jgi:hypothetical protein
MRWHFVPGRLVIYTLIWAGTKDRNSKQKHSSHGAMSRHDMEDRCLCGIMKDYSGEAHSSQIIESLIIHATLMHIIVSIN